MHPPVTGDGEGWIEYRIFLSSFTETSARGKELEALSWIPLLEKDASTLLAGHHWHREEFRLRLVTSEKAATIHAKDGTVTSEVAALRLTEPHLVGRTEYGESLDDEWLIVWLLFELSKRHPSILISTIDNDGQFLLIEAALVLPRWLKPENSDHRVWIRGGRLHIIPRPSAADPSIPAKLDLKSALNVLRSRSSSTRADENIERAIKDRLVGMPNVELDLLHHATLILPLEAARMFLIDPSLVGAAVNAFYTRDMDGMKAVVKMTRFDPRKSAAVPLRLRFTRLQYAQLARQSFPPPPAFTLPPPNAPNFVAAELGMKLTSGLEMLAVLAKPEPTDDLAPIPSPALPVAAADAEWEVFLRLVRAHEANTAEEDAAYAFLRITRAALYREANRKSVHFKLRTASATVLSEEKLKQATQGERVADDPLEWMNVTPEMVDDLLARAEKELNEAEKKGDTTKPPPSTEEMKDAIKAFVESKSGVEGVELPRQSGEEIKGRGDETDDSEMHDDPMIDPEVFMKALRSTLEKKGEDFLDDGGSSDEGGEDDDDDDDEDDDEEGEMNSEDEAEFRAYMDEMERQLRGTAMADTFERQKKPKDEKAAKEKNKNDDKKKKEDDDDDDDDDELPPVDIDLNLVKNMLDSLAGQQGVPGPASALLASMQQAQRNKK